MDLTHGNDLPGWVSIAKALMPGGAAVLASIAASLGVWQYAIAAKAERRLNDSASMENSIKASQHLSVLMQRADGRGLIANGIMQPDGLASQKTAIVEIGRLCVLYNGLIEASLAGLGALRDMQGMGSLHDDLDATISRITATKASSRKRR